MTDLGAARGFLLAVVSQWRRLGRIESELFEEICRFVNRLDLQELESPVGDDDVRGCTCPPEAEAFVHGHRDGCPRSSWRRA